MTPCFKLRLAFNFLNLKLNVFKLTMHRLVLLLFYSELFVLLTNAPFKFVVILLKY
jgi:hypothetical protein